MDTKIKHWTKSLLILLVIPSMSFKLLHWLKNSIEKELDNFITVQGEHNDCQEKIMMAEDQSFLHLKCARDIQKEFEEFVEKVKLDRDSLTSETIEVGTQAVMCSRVLVMMEFKRGEWDPWVVDSTVKAYTAKYPEDVFPLDELNSGGDA